MLFHIEGGGRFGNQNINLINFLALSIEYKVNIYSFPLFFTHGIFKINEKTIKNFKHKKNFPYLLRLLQYCVYFFVKFLRINCVILNDTELNINTKRVIFDQEIFLRDSLSQNTVLFGWSFRFWGLVQKHEEKIRKLFLELMPQKNSKKDNRTLLVHMRGSDFKTHAGGKLYYSFNDYLTAIEKIEKDIFFSNLVFLSDDKTIYDQRQLKTYASKKKYPKKISKGCVTKEGSQEDAFNELLMADFIVTSGSSFSLSAAWFSNSKAIDINCVLGKTSLNCIISSNLFMDNESFSLNWK